MKKHGFFILLFFVYQFSTLGQGQIKLFEDYGIFRPYFACTNDSSYTFAGDIVTEHNGKSKVFIYNVNLNLDSVWAKIFINECGGYGYIKDFESFQDGYYCLSSHNFEEEDSTIYFSLFMRLNNLGDTIWTRKISNVFGRSIGIIDSQNIYVFGGLADSTYMIKFNDNGDELSKKAMAWVASQNALVTYDKNFVLYYFGWLNKIDTNGNIIWKGNLKNANSILKGPDTMQPIVQVPDSGFLIISDTVIVTLSNNYDVLLTKVDKEGNYQWSKTFGGSKNDIAESIINSHNGNFIISGFTRSTEYYNLDGYSLFIFEVDEQGNLVSKNFYSNLFFTPFITCALANNNLGYLFVGFSSGTTGHLINFKELNVYAGRDKTIICGDSIKLSPKNIYFGTDSLEYSWEPNNNISDTNVVNPTVKPSIDFEYILNVSSLTETKSDTIAIFVETNYYPSFSANNLSFNSPPFVVNLTNNTYDLDRYNFKWDFSDTILWTNEVNVAHEYKYNGVYSIKLYAQSKLNNQCTDSIVRLDYIDCSGGDDPTAVNMSFKINHELIQISQSSSFIELLVKPPLESYLINIYDVNGKKIYESFSENQEHITIPKEEVPRGLLVIELIGKNRLIREKIILIK